MNFEIPISLPTDDDGLTGRECPQHICEGYFKVKFGTGIKDADYNRCFCPYCGYSGKQDQFFTKEQVKYIESIAVRHFQGIIKKEAKKWDRELRSSTRKSFIKLSVDYKSSHRPIAYYAEKEVETRLVCENCTLEYAIYGKFANCPDCGKANTLQILNANLSLIHKLLIQAEIQTDPSFREYLIHNALEDIVSSFDSFGRNSISIAVRNTTLSDLSTSFQNILKAKDRIEQHFGFDFSQALSEGDWNLILALFQKRHLISHNDGIIDEAYVQITGDNSAVIGRKIVVTIDEVRTALQYISSLATSLTNGLAGVELDE